MFINDKMKFCCMPSKIHVFIAEFSDLLKSYRSALITTNTESTSWPFSLKSCWSKKNHNSFSPIIEKLAVWLGNKE